MYCEGELLGKRDESLLVWMFDCSAFLMLDSLSTHPSRSCEAGPSSATPLCAKDGAGLSCGWEAAARVFVRERYCGGGVGERDESGEGERGEREGRRRRGEGERWRVSVGGSEGGALTKGGGRAAAGMKEVGGG